MTRVVLVPGACHGGWWYAPLAQRLQALGHVAVQVTPGGLEQEPRLDRPITLDTHIQDALDAVPAGNERDVVLVGHSYGGSIISGVADAVPERVRALVYLDAFVPEDGDSALSMTNDQEREWYVDGARRTGYGVDPLPFFDDRARPHPVATLLQASRLTGAWRQVPTKTYAAALDWPGDSPLQQSVDKVRADPEFVVHDWQTRHNVMHDGPDRVLDLLTDLP